MHQLLFFFYFCSGKNAGQKQLMEGQVYCDSQLEVHRGGEGIAQGV